MFKPILDRILIKRIEAEAAVDGFTVPEKYRQHTNKGRVVAVGDGVAVGGAYLFLNEIVKPGDIVLYGEYTAEKFDYDGEEFWIVRVQDVRGVERE